MMRRSNSRFCRDEPETVWAHLAHILKPVAEKYNLTLHAFDGEDAAYNSISLSSKKTSLKTAPVTPTSIDVVSPYAVISGTIRALYGEDTMVAPALMTGNTDTRYYWDLTKHIFRKLEQEANGVLLISDSADIRIL